MAIFYNGKEVAQPVYNTNNIDSAYYNGNCVFSGTGEPSYLKYFNFGENIYRNGIFIALRNNQAGYEQISYSGLNTNINLKDAFNWVITSEAKKLSDIYLNMYCHNMCCNLSNVADFSNIIKMNWYYVTDTRRMFYRTGINSNIQLPNGLLDSSYMFSMSAMNQNIYIPDTVTNAKAMFSYCTQLNHNIHISNNAYDTGNMFQNCLNLNQNIQIPNSVTNCEYMFQNCLNLNQNIQIPNSVKNATNMFCNCYNLPVGVGSINLLYAGSIYYNCRNMICNEQALTYGVDIGNGLTPAYGITVGGISSSVSALTGADTILATFVEIHYRNINLKGTGLSTGKNLISRMLTGVTNGTWHNTVDSNVMVSIDTVYSTNFGSGTIYIYINTPTKYLSTGWYNHSFSVDGSDTPDRGLILY